MTNNNKPLESETFKTKEQTPDWIKKQTILKTQITSWARDYGLDDDDHLPASEAYEMLEDGVLHFLATQHRELVEKARITQKANLEQLMVYLFREVSKSKTMRLGRKRQDWLWGAMCHWCDEYVKKPYKDITLLQELK